MQTALDNYDAEGYRRLSKEMFKDASSLAFDISDHRIVEGFQGGAS